MNDCSDKIQPVQPVEKTHMSIYSYPVFNQKKKKRKQEESTISFKELLDKELEKLRKENEFKLQPHEELLSLNVSEKVKPILSYSMMNLLGL